MNTGTASTAWTTSPGRSPAPAAGDSGVTASTYIGPVASRMSFGTTSTVGLPSKVYWNPRVLGGWMSPVAPLWLPRPSVMPRSVAVASACRRSASSGNVASTLWYTLANAAQSRSRLPVNPGSVAWGWSTSRRCSSAVNRTKAPVSTTRLSRRDPL